MPLNDLDGSKKTIHHVTESKENAHQRWLSHCSCFKHDMPEFLYLFPLDRRMQQTGFGTPPMRGHITKTRSTKYQGFTMISRLCNVTGQSRKTATLF